MVLDGEIYSYSFRAVAAEVSEGGMGLNGTCAFVAMY